MSLHFKSASCIHCYENHTFPDLQCLSYVTPEEKMIARMLHLLFDENHLHNEKSGRSVKEYMAEYKIGNRSVYDILDQICKDTDLYPYVKQHKSTRDQRGAFYAIYSRWLGPNHLNATLSDAELVLQILMYDSEKKTLN